MKKVGVVLLNYKVKDLTLRCIESVKKSTYKNIQIFVVDNDSRDGLAETMYKYPEVIFIPSKENTGYSGGNNLGIKKALDEKCDVLFILNPDMMIDPKAIEILVSEVEKVGAGIANPKIYFEGTKKLWFAGKQFDLNNVLATHRGVNEEDQGQYDKVEELEDATGGALLVQKEVFEKIGLFDERYFLYYEDGDFSYRARKAGFKIIYVPQAVAYHKNAQSTGLGSPIQDYYITRNRMLFAAKFLSFRTRFALFREALRNLNQPIRRKAFFDFLMGNFGRAKL